MAPALLLAPSAVPAGASPAAVLTAQPPAAQPAPQAAQAQRRATGRVTNAASGAPIEGVSVRAPGTTVGAVTNAEGRYTIVASSSASALVFTRIGMVRQEVYHFGGVMGFSAENAWFPAGSLSVTVLYNSQGPANGFPTNFIVEIARAVSAPAPARQR